MPKKVTDSVYDLYGIQDFVPLAVFLVKRIDKQRFQALEVVRQTTRNEITEMNVFFDKLEGIFQKEDFTKEQVIESIKEFIPNFEHEEGRDLDQKM